MFRILMSAKWLPLAYIDPTDSRQLEAWERRTLERGLAEVLVESDRLRQLGIIDDAGRLLTDRLPDDMRSKPRHDGGR